jgi:tetratricopeptide (TPR) repeat protein
LILGDLPQAAALLDRAAELDPTSPELAYRRARVLEQMAEPVAAVSEYCRALSLSPEGRVNDATIRLEALLDEQRAALPAEAITALNSGLAATDRGAMSDALTSFQRAAERAPEWATAQYNWGVALAGRGRGSEAVVALLRYLELSPGAPDAIAVSRRVGQLQRAAVAAPSPNVAVAVGPSPGVAVALGLLVPGMGQFYVRRPLGGLVVLSLAGGAVAAGLFVTEVSVRCLTSVPAGERCPEDEVVARETSQPYLQLAIGAAAAAGLIGALEAFFDARQRRERARTSFISNGSQGPTLEGPAMTVRSGQVELSLVRLRFR